jgi:hypothetical protein
VRLAMYAFAGSLRAGLSPLGVMCVPAGVIHLQARALVVSACLSALSWFPVHAFVFGQPLHVCCWLDSLFHKFIVLSAVTL